MEIFENEDAPGDVDDLGHVRRDQDNRFLLFIGQVPDKLVNIFLGVDVDAGGRLPSMIKISHWAASHLADADLCWLPPL
ncbi:MAG: hypothetical protein U0X20_07395 [Caldilineaceae bacterium]